MRMAQREGDFPFFVCLLINESIRLIRVINHSIGFHLSTTGETLTVNVASNHSMVTFRQFYNHSGDNGSAQQLNL